MVNSFKLIVKTMVLEGFAGWVCERKRYQTNIKNESKTHSKIDVKTMLKKVMPKCWYTVRKLIPKVAKSRQI